MIMKRLSCSLVISFVCAVMFGLAVCAAGQFADVQDVNKYYYNAVYWAADNGITSGTSATTFSPDSNCTRGQIVTFLWRAAGQPAPSSAETSFTDVPAGKFYSTAVAWAVENKITSGTSATTFSPDDTCSRAQIVTFLWRSENRPAPSGRTSFIDVPDDSYYASAVAWAVEQNITKGTSGNTFSPDQGCTRGQIAAFLYRKFTDSKDNTPSPSPAPSPAPAPGEDDGCQGDPDMIALKERVIKEIKKTCENNGVTDFSDVEINAELDSYTGYFIPMWYVEVIKPGGIGYTFRCYIKGEVFHNEFRGGNYKSDNAAISSIKEERPVTTEMTEGEKKFYETPVYFYNKFYGEGMPRKYEEEKNLIYRVLKASEGMLYRKPGIFTEDSTMFYTVDELKSQILPIQSTLEEYINWYETTKRITIYNSYLGRFNNAKYEKMLKMVANNSSRNYSLDGFILQDGTEISLPTLETAYYVLSYAYLLEGDLEKCIEAREKLAALFDRDKIDESDDEHVYDTYGRLIEYNPSGNNHTPQKSIYDSNGRIAQITMEKTNYWSKNVYTYLSDGRLASSVSDSKTLDNEPEHSETQYTYNNNDKNKVKSLAKYPNYDYESEITLHGYGMNRT